jgi:putative transposase
MAFQPTHLTRAQLEERRRLGARLLRAGKLSQAEIARRLGVSRSAVSQWANQLAQGGWRLLRSRKSNGRPPKLSQAQKQGLRRLLKRGARHAGFPTERWTLQRIQTLIEREFQVTYHPTYVARLLKQLGWSPQVPLPRAKERDEALIRAWLAQDWPRIKKSAATRRRNRVS